MQSVVHTSDYVPAHWLLNEIDRFYAEMSTDTPSSRLVPDVYDDNLENLYTMFRIYGNITHTVEFKSHTIEKLKLPKYNSKSIIVCYSGGKDSYRTAVHYINLGYDVTLFYVHGVNRGYLGEKAIAIKGAEHLGVPIHCESVSYVNSHMWMEHPMKNMIIANMALTYGIKSGNGTNIAFGNYRTSYLYDNEFDVCGGDCVDMWECYENIIQNIIPNFHIRLSNISYQTTYNFFAKHPQELRYTISCMTTNRFRELFKKRTSKNYSVELLPNRCGCCWKCALEYIWFADKGCLDFNKNYYLHCLEILYNSYKKESGNTVIYVRDIWSQYIFYPITKSKAYREIKNATFSANGKIKDTNKDSKR